MISLPVIDRSETYELDPRIIIGVGLNYQTHIDEHKKINVQGFNDDVPTEPVIFPKTVNCLIGNGEPIVIPRFIEEYNFAEPKVDHEAELAFIIKDHCKNVPVEEALEHVLGYTCMNDVSQRNFQRSDKSGWFRAKSLDTFGPVGPALLLAEDLNAPQSLDVFCRVNGEQRQASNTSQMIFPVAQLLSFISRNLTLEAGDLVTTGTPAGVGPLRHGDVVEVEIERIGVLRNPVVVEGQ